MERTKIIKVKKYLVRLLVVCLCLKLSLLECAYQDVYAQNYNNNKSITVELKELMKKGMVLERDGKYDEAKLIYENIIKTFPDFPDVYARLAYTLQKIGYGKEAGEFFSKCQKLGVPNKSDFIPELGDMLPGVLNTNSVIMPSPKTESDLIKSEGVVQALIYSEAYGMVLVLVTCYDTDKISISGASVKIGIGSELRFDKKDWVDFVGGKYRKGGVSITGTGIRFWEGTERLEMNKLSIVINGKWCTQGGSAIQDQEEGKILSEKKKDTTLESKKQTVTSGVYAKEVKVTLVGKVEMKYVKPINGIDYDVVGDESLIEVDEVLKPCITVSKATDKNGKVISEMKGKSIIVFGEKTSELEKFDGKEVQAEGIIKDNKAIDVTTVTEITKRVEHALTSVEQKNEQKTKQVEGTSTIPQYEKKKKSEDGNQLDTKNKQKNSPEATTFPFDFINILEEIYKKTVNISGTFEFRKGMKLPGSLRMARDSFEDLRRFFGDDFLNKFLSSSPENIKGKFSGTGFLINADGYVLTGYRLIEGANSIIVTSWDNSSYKGEIVVFDKDADIALVKIYSEKKITPVAKLCNNNEIKSGEHFLAVGKLFVDSCNFTFDSIKSIDEYIQIKDVILSKYLYGGPLFNIRGEVIGVITLPSIEGNKLREAKQPETVFVVPASKINKLIQKLDYKRSNSQSFTGGKNYGMTVQNLTKELAKSFDVKGKNLDIKEWCGVIVTNVLSRSPAGMSDIRKGDRIIEVNRKKIHDIVDFEEALSETDEEKCILFFVKRGEYSKYIIIKSDKE